MSEKQQHLDRLSSTDASFLHTEGSASHMHIGGVLLFEGPAPDFEDVIDHIRGRLHLVPRYRQKLATPPFSSGRQLWVDDTSFNIEYHVRNSALPAPGSQAQLLEMAARLASAPLDRTKPLWEFYVIEGIEPSPGSTVERFAILNKTHHALVDGVAGVDLASVLFDVSPVPWQPDEPLEPWVPQPEPSQRDLLAGSVRGALNTAVELAGWAVNAAGTPARTVHTMREAAEGVGEIVWAALNPAPATPLNVPIGPHRRFRVVRQELAQYKQAKDAFGGTVNDVVLSVVSGALAKWLHSRGIRTDGVELRALVPVSVRTEDEHHQLGNKLVAMRGPLPVYIDDPVERLRVVSREMNQLKESKQAVGAATLAAVTELAPPTILAQAARIQFSTRLFNILVTNIPGPQIPLYLLGKQLQDVYPLAFLPDNQALAVAIMSYNGLVEYGLLGDFDVLPDIDVIADGIRESLDLLLEAAAGAGPGFREHPAPPAQEAAAAPVKPAAPAKPKPAARKPAPAKKVAAAKNAAPVAPAPAADTAEPLLPPASTNGSSPPESTDAAGTEADSQQQPSGLFPTGSAGRRSDGPAAAMRAKRSRRGA